MSRHLKTFLTNTGFVNVESGYGADAFVSPEEVEFLAKFLQEWALSPEFREKTSGTEKDFDRWRQQVRRWSRRKCAVGCFHFGHAVGRKPPG